MRTLFGRALATYLRIAARIYRSRVSGIARCAVYWAVHTPFVEDTGLSSRFALPPPLRPWIKDKRTQQHNPVKQLKHRPPR